jgi:hypothetical protein
MQTESEEDLSHLQKIRKGILANKDEIIVWITIGSFIIGLVHLFCCFLR